ncbi:MAG: M48 family peptidase, partial [Rhodospirillaceae bacterium]|nr:M48 family peptidase [Rhodospirillaceae bacterium]
AWHLLATAYGRQGDLGMAALSLAEEALAQGDGRTALDQAHRAEAQLAYGSPGWLRLQDVLRVAEDLADED